MAHFAKLDKENVVLNVHVVNNDVITVDGVELEQAGIDFLKNLHGHDYWKQTSYNATFRKNYAEVGGYYDQEFDAFIAPQPYPSWKLDYTTYQWKPPIPKPDGEDAILYRWSEPNKEWIKVELPSA